MKLFKVLVSIFLSIYLSACCSLLLLKAPRPLKEIIDSVYESVVYLEGPGYSCSGFVIDKHRMATAGHCVKDLSTPLKITDFKGKEYVAIPILDDDISDLAILKVDTDLKPVEFGSLPVLGERLITVGYPGYWSGVKTFEVGFLKGVINATVAKPDGSSSTVKLLVSDGIAFSGESGGPVFNEFGEVVGIVSATAPTVQFFDYVRHQHKDISILISAEELKRLLWR